MSELKSIKRPNEALIKLIEAIGILLNVPKRFKSYYKVPSPSNYDNTIIQLTNDYSKCIYELSNLKSSSIDSRTAYELYEKMMEPGFDYESAIINGGLYCRELFDMVIYLISELQQDIERHPIESSNVYVLFNGSRSSYVALDTAVHIFNHGLCTATVLSLEEKSSESLLGTEITDLSHYLCSDIERRFKSLYKLPTYKYKINELSLTNESAFSNIINNVTEDNSTTFVLGIDEMVYDDPLQNALIQWAAIDSNITGVIVKGQSPVRPFESVVSSKCYLICIKLNDDYINTLHKALICLRPIDSYVILLLVESRLPKGDFRDTRFGLGSRYGWIDGNEEPLGPNKLGWNDNKINEMKNNLNSFIVNSKIQGRLRIEEIKQLTTRSQDITKYAIEEDAQVIILKKRHNKEIILQTINETSVAVIVVK